MKVLTLFLFLFFSTFAWGQEDYTTKKTASAKLIKLLDKANQLSRNEAYDAATKEIQKALKQDPNFLDAIILLANIQYDKRDYSSAAANYQKVIQLNEAYKPRLFYQLAIAQYRQDQFDEAIANWKKFLATAPRSEKIRQRTQRHIANATFVKEALLHPVPYEPKKLPGEINLPEVSEYLPSFTADEEWLIYTALVNGQEDFYYSQKQEDTWVKGTPIEEINTRLNEGAQCISADGKLLVFTACNRKDGRGSCDLYCSEKRGNAWTNPINMGSPINTGSWESQPALSADGKVLYFASDRQGGQGKRDLWVSYRQKNGDWSVPKNLGETINTSEDEQAPFIHQDGASLYFMSKGHPGMGGFDLYLARGLAQGGWETPTNLGYPINTKANEGALVVSLSGTTAYFATDQDFENEGSTQRFTDLYSFELPPAVRPNPVTYVKGIVVDATTKKPIPADLEILNFDSQKVHAAIATEADGSFLICLPAGANYALNISKPAYLFYSDRFELSTPAQITEPFQLEVALVPVPIAAEETADEKVPIILKNVFFETGSAALLTNSITELDQLFQLLQDNSNVNIQINGHTDNVGQPDDNLILSEKRAQAVLNYLVDKGIPEERLKAKGFGETKPIDSNETAEGRGNNRRTEFILID